MALADAFKSLQDIDFNDITLDNVGSWPIVVKAFVWGLVFAGVCFLGYNLKLKDMRAELDAARQSETQLRTQLEAKAFQVANLEALKAQLAEMEEQFGALLGQLPKDTEVPGLLEDITEKATDAGLSIATISLQPERTAEFYVELPIVINIVGAYHDMGAFTSGIAALPRIVTLHDFSIATGANTGNLKMQIQAKTYRYKGEE